MKKLFLNVLALIVLAGAVFAPSSAWSQSDCLIESSICQLPDVSVDALGITEAQINSTWRHQENLIANKISNVTVLAPLVVVNHRVLGVTSFNISCSGCHNANPSNDITANSHNQERVDILLC